ncbi:hypothetical protein MMC20_002123 [Loxospora ochrophaea]|nr:hypothetical protein [Loxospora ochrophaea]
MVPPLTVVSTSLSIAANAFKACKDTYELVRGIQEAPTRILRLSTDLHGVYTALGTLQSVLNTLDVIAQQTGLPGMIIADLEELLFNCIGVFVDIRKIIQPILSPDGSAIGGTWKGFKWESFKKGDVEVLQRMLSLYKSTLTFACFSLNLFYNSRTSRVVENSQTMLEKLQRDVFLLRQQLDNRERQEFPDQMLTPPNVKDPSEPLSLQRRLSVVSYNLPLRRFLERTESVITSSPSSSRAPSMVVSEGGEDASFDLISAEGNLAISRCAW